jgi:hypothetical protein
LADGPRQAINAITLYSFYLSKSGVAGDWYDFGKYFDKTRGFFANALTCTIVFTVVVFAVSLLLLIAAGICYIPLLMYIRGNLKEYCCHKVDKVRPSLHPINNCDRIDPSQSAYTCYSCPSQ